MDIVARRAARVLLIDGTGRLLMFHGWDPARPEHRYWFTVGGGLNDGESLAEGAARELAEETGLRVAPAELGAPVWRHQTEFPFDGRWYRQEQEFFVFRVESWDVCTDGFDEVEQKAIGGHRWWTADELSATAEKFYPTELPTLLRQLSAASGGVGLSAAAGGVELSAAAGGVELSAASGGVGLSVGRMEGSGPAGRADPVGRSGAAAC